MSKACEWRSFSRNLRRQSAIHRRDAPRSIRDQKNPKRRRSRLRLVQGQDPREKEEFFSFEASRDVFLRSKCTSLEEEYILLQVQPEVGMDDSNNANTSQVTTREELRDYFLASNKGWQRGQPTKTNSLIGEDFCDEKFLSSEEIFCLYCCLCFVSFRLYFCLLPSIVFFHFAKIAEAGMKGEISYLDAPDA